MKVDIPGQVGHLFRRTERLEVVVFRRAGAESVAAANG